jgi:hypothetical protein
MKRLQGRLRAAIEDPNPIIVKELRSFQDCQDVGS